MSAADGLQSILWSERCEQNCGQHGKTPNTNLQYDTSHPSSSF